VGYEKGGGNEGQKVTNGREVGTERSVKEQEKDGKTKVDV